MKKLKINLEQLNEYNSIWNKTKHFKIELSNGKVIDLVETETLKKLLEKLSKIEVKNKKYKEIINKAIKLNKQTIKDIKDFYRPTKDVIYSGDSIIDQAEQNLNILKGAE